MAATECVEDNNGVTQNEDLPCKNAIETMSKVRRNGLNNGFTYGDNGSLCVRTKHENLSQCVRVNGMTNLVENGSVAAVDRSISPLLSRDREPSPGGGGRKRRRTLRFDSSESSDSGVAALSSTDTSSQSSGTSDITEPCSPPSPESPRSCTPLPAGINGFNGNQHCCHNNNETFATTPISCASLNCEKTHSFQEVTKNCQNSKHFSSDKNSDQAGSYLNFCNLQKEIGKSNLHSESPESTFPQKQLCNGGDDYEESNFLLSENKKYALSEKNERRGVCEVVDLSPVKLDNETSIKIEPITKDLSYLHPKDNDVQKKKENVSDKLSKSKGNENVTCQWDECITIMKSGFEVVEHLQNVHVGSQKNAKTYVCLWAGCKVYNRTSCSLTWLERHVLTHAGNKPFQCIVDGCGQRFTSQGGLERHVNSHFNHSCSNNSVATHSGSTTSSATRRKDDTPTKIVKKKRLRFRRRGWTVKTEDFFDAGMMECVQHHLVTLNSNNKLDLDGTCRTVTFYSTVMAKRTEASGKVRALLHWTPENIFPDQWILESQVESWSKWTIPLPLIPRESLALIDPSLSHRYQRLRKNRRK